MREGSLTSSIGADWPPVHGTNERIRGFYPQTVESDADVLDFIDEFESLQRLTEQADGVDRLSIRVVASAGMIATMHARGVHIEGTLPVAHKDRELYIAYTAWNDPARRMDDERLSQHHRIIDAVMQRPRIYDDPRETLRSKGFEPRVIDGSVPAEDRIAEAPKFFDLYGRFNYDQADVRALLTDPTNTIAYVEDEHGLASTVLAERADVEVDGCGTIRLVELTEAVTRPELQGHDLYRAVSGIVTRAIVEANMLQPEQPVNVLYGESNLSSPGVIFAAWKNGRNIAYNDGILFGIDRPSFGILEQNFSVDDGNEDRKYNDFALTYYPL